MSISLYGLHIPFFLSSRECHHQIVRLVELWMFYYHCHQCMSYIWCFLTKKSFFKFFNSLHFSSISIMIFCALFFELIFKFYQFNFPNITALTKTRFYNRIHDLLWIFDDRKSYKNGNNKPQTGKKNAFSRCCHLKQ